MKLINCLPVALFAVLAGPAFAETLNCSFTTECYGAEACQETAFDIEMADDGAGWTLSSIAGDALMNAVPGDSTALRGFVSPVAGDTMHVLTLFEDGKATYATNSWYGEPVTLTYFGNCEAAG